jgi:hypothetical protein
MILGMLSTCSYISREVENKIRRAVSGEYFASWDEYSSRLQPVGRLSV